MDLLQSQIKESCNLALPEGLKDLMSDISREVLRSQPNDVIQFIVGYLKVLLEVREKLAIACHICNDTYKCNCDSNLYHEIKAIGLDDEDVDSAIKIIEDHFERGNVEEQKLLIKLAKKLNIDEAQLTSIQEVIQKSFNRHVFSEDVFDVNVSDEVTGAVHHTLDMYRHQQQIVIIHIRPEEVFISSYEQCHRISSSASLVSEHDNINLDENPMQTEEKSEDVQQYQTSGKVKFIEEKDIFNIQDQEKSTSSDESYLDEDIEELIKTEQHDDTASIIEEDFAADPEHSSINTLQTL
ncbi:unnamed protein product [Danaus chrysippus]|uniref:(African queen) hypothetical protein n=1 Tax=Danaus chrysippus TaxID=151541 RepID=A0A8J2QP95_9NEOP|nr:unnamed protein product [Danaus chrysippus]